MFRTFDISAMRLRVRSLARWLPLTVLLAVAAY